MSSFYKVCTKIALVIIGLGIILAIIGLTTGASLDSLSIGPVKLIEPYSVDTGISVDTDITTDTGINNSNRSNYSSFKESYENVKSIHVDINYGTLIIKEGDNFKVEANHVENNQIKSYVKEDTLTIEDKSVFGINIFGIRLGGSNKRFSKNNDIVIYIPKDFVAEEIIIEVGAGSVDADNLNGKEVSLDVGAGEFYAEQITAIESADIEVGAGKIEIDNITSLNTDISCGIGSIEMDGIIKGDSNIECGVGEVLLNLDGNEEYYNYYVDSGIGDVIINDSKFSFSSSTQMTSDNAKADFNIECGVGRVEIRVE